MPDGAALLFVTLPMVVAVLMQRRPVMRYQVPRVVLEVAVLVLTGIVGTVIGGDNGPLVALLGYAIYPWMLLLTRRCNRAVARVDAPGLSRSLRHLETAWWPVATTPTSLSYHERLAAMTGADTLAMYTRKRNRGRATPLLDLRIAVARGNTTLARTYAHELMAPDSGLAEQSEAAAWLAGVDLPAVLAWWRSPASGRVRRRCPVATLDAVATHAARAELTDDQRRQVAEMAVEYEHVSDAFGKDRGAWRPWASWSLALMMSTAFAYQLLRGGFGEAALVHQGAFIGGTEGGAWWRAVTASVLHANATHLLFNLFGLLVIGRIAEARVPRPLYLGVWFAASIGGFAVYALFPPHDPLLGVGASGGVMGVLGLSLAVFVVNHRHRRSAFNTRELRQLSVVTALQLLVDQLVPNIAALGHFAGLAIGVVAGLAVYGARSEPGRPAPSA